MKRNLEGILIALLVLIFSVAACSKEEIPGNLPEGATNISAQIGDEQWEALDYKSALNIIPGRGQYFELSSSSSKYRINFSVLEFDNSTGTISEGEYFDNIFFSIFLADEAGDFTIEYKPLELDENVENPFIIKVTASTNSRITGTFSGMVQKVSEENVQGSPEVLNISNGIFNNLPFKTRTVNVQ